MHNTLEAIDTKLLDAVTGGFPNGLPGQGQQPQPKTWSEGLDRSLKRRGLDGNIDPGMTKPPPNPNMDPGINKQWDPFKAPTRERGA